jgi:coatomer protein complex subunit alpha (xenin)
LNLYIIFHAGIPGSGSIVLPLMRNDAIGHPGNDSLPRIPVNMKTLVAGVRQGYRLFQTGKFNDAKNAFSEVLAQIPLTVTDNRNDVNEIKKMLEICREYITAIRIKGAMTAAGDDPVRSTELSAYFTHCDLQPMHLLLALRSAMGTAFKHKNFIVAASMARRLLELPDMKSERNADLRMKVGSFISPGLLYISHCVQFLFQFPFFFPFIGHQSSSKE